MEQENYDRWVQDTDPNKQDQICGGQTVSPNEMYFIEKYAKINILDIGCGTGHRTFPIWMKRGLNFYGFEKFQNLIDESDYRDNILQIDISADKLNEKINELKLNHFDISFLFGGVINGIIDNNLQLKTWENFKFLLNICDYILIDTLTHFNWFSIEQTGRVVQLHTALPPQYFYSKKELETFNNEFGLEFIEERSECIGPLKRTNYLIRKKTI